MKILLLISQLFLFLPLSVKSQQSPFYFIQITDPQLGFIDSNKSFEKEVALFKQAAEAINKLSPACVIITGDFVHDGKDSSQLEAFMELTNEFRKGIPIYLLPGNHDILEIDQKDIDEYIDRYGYDRFNIQYNNTSILGINTQIMRGGEIPEEREQLNWIKQVLQDSKGCDNIIVLGHHPIFTTNAGEEDSYNNIPLTIRDQYISLFHKYGVKKMFAGHLHHNNTATDGDLTIQATSALGRPLGSDKSGIRIIRVYPGNIESDYYAVDEIPSEVEL